MKTSYSRDYADGRVSKGHSDSHTKQTNEHDKVTFDRILLRPFRANPVVDIIHPGRRFAARRVALPWAMAVLAPSGRVSRSGSGLSLPIEKRVKR